MGDQVLKAEFLPPGVVQTAARRTANRMPLATQMAAVAWLRECPEMAAQQPQGHVAQRLAEFLGRPVTVGNLGTLAKAAGVRLHGYASVAEDGKALVDLQYRLDRLSERVAALESVSHRHGAMGSEVGV